MVIILLGHLLVFFIQYLEIFLFELSFYTLFPCYILFHSRADYYQIWRENKQVQILGAEATLKKYWLLKF